METKSSLHSKKPMVKPTLQEIATYFKEQGHSTAMALAFFERYEHNEWTVHDQPCERNHWRSGRKPMTNWKSAAKSFMIRDNILQKRPNYRPLRA